MTRKHYDNLLSSNIAGAQRGFARKSVPRDQKKKNPARRRAGGGGTKNIGALRKWSPYYIGDDSEISWSLQGTLKLGSGM